MNLVYGKRKGRLQNQKVCSLVRETYIYSYHMRLDIES